MTVSSRWKVFDRNDWGFTRKRRTKDPKGPYADWYSNIDEFLESPGWATVFGGL